MLDLLKKSVYASIGFALLSAEKAESLGKKIAKEAEMSEVEGQKFVEEMIKKSAATRASIEKVVREKIEAAFATIDLPTKKELAALERRIEKLEQKSA